MSLQDQITLAINTAEDAERIQQNLKLIKLNLRPFKEATISKLANSLALDKIHQKMRDAAFSEKIIEGTTITRFQFVSRTRGKIHFKSELFAGEPAFDVALAREEGTKDHDLPKVEGRTYAWEQGGEILFSKGHRVSGLPALKIIQSILKEIEEPLQDMYDLELRMWLEKNLRL